MTMPNPAANAEGRCLVCGHSADDHAQATRVCAGVGGLCQCHAYNPHEHPVQRLAARRRAAGPSVSAAPGGTGMADIDQQTQERLQAAMERRAGELSALSAMETKVNATGATLTAHLK